MLSVPSVAVVGAGLTGLAAAFRLSQAGLAVTVYEATRHAGGVVRTERRDGYLAELGPNSLVKPAPAVEALLADLGLADRLVAADAAARHRYVVRRGRLVPVPMSPQDLVTSRLLSSSAKLAVAREPFVPPADLDVEESVAAFVRRRLGQELVDYFANPFVAGVYAGDPEELSVRHAFPKLYAMEREHGSILRAVIRAAKARRESGDGGAGRSVYSFTDGLGVLPATLAARLGEAIRYGGAVRQIRRDGAAWEVSAEYQPAANYDAVIYAGPAHRLADIDFAITGGERLAAVASIPHPPVAVVVLGFRREDVRHPLDGFGLLVPTVERRNVLGVIFSSTLFPDRAPEGHVLLTAMVGGTRNPQLAGADPHTLLARVMDDHRALLGVRGEPTFREIYLWPEAIPQYVVGFGRFRELMDDIEKRNAGLFLAGTYRDGVSVGDALGSGIATAARVAEQVAATEAS